MITPQVIAQCLGLRKSGRSWLGACPACGYKDTFTLTEKERNTLVYCHSCEDTPAILAELKRLGLWGKGGNTPLGSYRPCPVQPTVPNDAWKRWWERSIPFKSTLADVYLQYRGFPDVDCAKNGANIEKHGIDFSDILSLFEGKVIEKVDNRFDYAETRITALGEVNGYVLFVVYTLRGETRCIIFARLVNQAERSYYYG